jgi:pantetheine-phosphate adenylyltransferase
MGGYMQNFRPILNRYVEINTENNRELRLVLKGYLDKIENEKHRYYHTLAHVCGVYNRLNDRSLLSIIFSITHDIVYNPRSKTNEEDSIHFISNDLRDEPYFDELCELIRDTKDINKITKHNSADRGDVIGGFGELRSYFNLIRKEFDCYYYEDFINKHCSIIMQIRNAHNADKKVSLDYIEFVRRYKPTATIYTGSFNPFHIGHYSIAIEAENIFDKVIIAKGFNPDKTTTNQTNEILPWDDVPSAISCKETVIYTGTIFDLYEHYSKLYDKITFIKGFRSGHDIEYDLHQYRVIRDINPNINFIFLPCNPGMEHVSSSMIRNLEKLKLPTDKYVVK